ncbi:MAG TPA: MltA domain-containing protein [Methylocella sp.]|nr:MltA domain-containing protein [Methylocella sp.]
MNSSTLPPGVQDRADLTPLSFEDLTGFPEDDHLAAFRVFLHSCVALAAKAPPLRQGIAAPAALEAVAHTALRQEIHTAGQARQFFEAHFRPFRVAAKALVLPSSGFLTGYYEPVVEGSLMPSREFAAPILGRPDNLEFLAPYPDRATIESGAVQGHAMPVVWLHDLVEVFLIQVQGSARVRLTDGKTAQLVYAGRNGQPYTSIGRILIENGEIAESEMSLGALKEWIRAHGQNPGDAGLALMHRNKSYVFFALEEDDGTRSPIGGQGIGLTALRSIAVDRTFWPYGLPFWIAAELPWRSSSGSPFRRLMVAQDTGSAIVGPARVDIFFGSGDDAGLRAGDIRHEGDVVAFLPA